MDRSIIITLLSAIVCFNAVLSKPQPGSRLNRKSNDDGSGDFSSRFWGRFIRSKDIRSTLTGPQETELCQSLEQLLANLGCVSDEDPQNRQNGICNQANQVAKKLIQELELPCDLNPVPLLSELWSCSAIQNIVYSSGCQAGQQTTFSVHCRKIRAYSVRLCLLLRLDNCDIDETPLTTTTTTTTTATTPSTTTTTPTTTTTTTTTTKPTTSTTTPTTTTTTPTTTTTTPTTTTTTPTTTTTTPTTTTTTPTTTTTTPTTTTTTPTTTTTTPTTTTTTTTTTAPALTCEPRGGRCVSSSTCGIGQLRATALTCPTNQICCITLP